MHYYIIYIIIYNINNIYIIGILFYVIAHLNLSFKLNKLLFIYFLKNGPDNYGCRVGWFSSKTSSLWSEETFLYKEWLTLTVCNR